ncbi:MAG: proline-specific permease ProY, partial [Mixta calida]|nr:proline-specific permease ProY [Mixta calida]
GMAPNCFLRIARNGVPWMTVVVMAVALLGAVVLNYLIPEQVFVLIASLAAFATLWVWLMILLSHFAMRRSLTEQERADIRFPVPFWPVAPVITLLFMLLVIGVLGAVAETRMALIVGLFWLAGLTLIYFWRVKKRAGAMALEQPKS